MRKTKADQFINKTLTNKNKRLIKKSNKNMQYYDLALVELN